MRTLSSERLFSDGDLELVGADHGREVLDDSPDNASDPWAAQALACLLVDLDAGPLGGLSAA